MEQRKELIKKIVKEINIKMFDIGSKVSHQRSIVKGIEAEYDYVRKQLDIKTENLRNSTTENHELREKEFNECWIKMGELYGKLTDGNTTLLALELERQKEFERIAEEVNKKYRDQLILIMEEQMV